MLFFLPTASCLQPLLGLEAQAHLTISLPRRAQRYPPVLCPSQGSGTPVLPSLQP